MIGKSFDHILLADCSAKTKPRNMTLNSKRLLRSSVHSPDMIVLLGLNISPHGGMSISLEREDKHAGVKNTLL